ncbi:MAG TPA: hypothetical protein PLF01_01365 [Alphaproteobacteria bacterium]|nr:hypothetical protein [Alphaproteobacteria bacterium]
MSDKYKIGGNGCSNGFNGDNLKPANDQPSEAQLMLEALRYMTGGYHRDLNGDDAPDPRRNEPHDFFFK